MRINWWARKREHKTSFNRYVWYLVLNSNLLLPCISSSWYGRLFFSGNILGTCRLFCCARFKILWQIEDGTAIVWPTWRLMSWLMNWLLGTCHVLTPFLHSGNLYYTCEYCWINNKYRWQEGTHLVQSKDEHRHLFKIVRIIAHDIWGYVRDFPLVCRSASMIMTDFWNWRREVFMI